MVCYSLFTAWRKLPEYAILTPQPIDFADFATALSSSASSLASSALSAATGGASATSSPFTANNPFFGGSQQQPAPYTKWYRVWERVSPSDFYQEAFIVPFILLTVTVHYWGRRVNRRKARNWAAAHAPTLQKEFAHVGFGGSRAPTAQEIESSGAAKAASSEALVLPDELIKEKSAQEFLSYASGRQNVAFVDVRLEMFKRYNPASLLMEWALSMLFESFPPPAEKMHAIAYAFDGREKDLVPVRTEQQQIELEGRVRNLQSGYDGFVWAVVHKDSMKRLRDERYDISLTFTKDNPKLPDWATVMSESAEITDFMLTDELAKVVKEAGEAVFDNLIVSDQPIDKPQKYVLQFFTIPPRSFLELKPPPISPPITISYANLNPKD